jgi:hypothetical protein
MALPRAWRHRARDASRRALGGIAREMRRAASRQIAKEASQQGLSGEKRR